MRQSQQINFVAGAGVAALMATQSFLGLLFPQCYRDAEWIKITWLGNDWVTLTVVLPLNLAGIAFWRQGSIRGTLLWLGTLGYGIYNYAFYLFGAALNAFFPLYVTALLAASLALFFALRRLDVQMLAAAFERQTLLRFVGGYLGVVGVALAGAWLALWAAYVFAGRETPVEPEAFKLVAALDCVLMTPALVLGGIWLWQERVGGYVLSAIASIQGALYLLVLSVNSLLFVQRGTVEAPGEMPVWGTLAVLTSVAAVVLVGNIRLEPGGGKSAASGKIRGRSDPS